jgi:hypothetical protein
MTDKEFLYSMYNKELVDRAYEATANFFGKESFEADVKLAKIAEKYNVEDETTAGRLYDRMLLQMVFSYLHGADYAVRNELGSVAPSEETFSDYHKNVDFAVLFDFSDNDFGLAMEAGAKLFCDEFNGLLRQIDLYNDHTFMRDGYIKRFEDICKVENIKEIMKCGFLAERMKDYADVRCARKMPNADDSLDEVRSDMNYIPWGGDKNKYERIDGEYKVVGKFPRFITGTNKEITEALEKYGHPDENPTRTFPVWCNGEVIILYMSDGYLTYLTR